MRAVLVAVLAIPLGILGCSLWEGEPETVVQESSFHVGGSPRLVVETENGDITVRSSGGAGEVRVAATIRVPDRVEYETEQIGDTVSVSADVAGGIAINARVDVEVEVPERTQLELATSNGNITVRDADGSVSATTSNGGITFAGSLGPGTQANLSASNGDVEVTLVDTQGVWLDAEASNGEISSELPITATSRSDDERVTGSMGDGSGSLKVRTSNGDITVR